jgi:hypothetical protein
LLSLIALAVSPCIPAMGQGCVAAHSNQRVIGELVRTDTDAVSSMFSIHNLTVDIGYRVFNSNKYFQGSDEIARPTAVRKSSEHL